MGSRKYPHVCLGCSIAFIGFKNTKYCEFACYTLSRKGKPVTHGASGHPLYDVWRGMISRCHNPNHPKFVNWGGRGITVCKAWREDVWAFIRWAERNDYQKGLEIDRKNNNGNYTPKNCHFVTDREQANNRRWRPAAYTAQGLENISRGVAESNRRRAATRAGRAQMLKNLGRD